MIKFRFYIHTWSPINGHKDRRVTARGTTMAAALEFTVRTLEAREPGVIVNAKRYEQV
jgi:hypothetical protein